MASPEQKVGKTSFKESEVEAIKELLRCSAGMLPDNVVLLHREVMPIAGAGEVLVIQIGGTRIGVVEDNAGCLQLRDLDWLGDARRRLEAGLAAVTENRRRLVNGLRAIDRIEAACAHMAGCSMQCHLDIENPRWLRARLGMSVEDFASVFCLPMAAVTEWEDGRLKPDPGARALLAAIVADPWGVSKAISLTLAELRRRSPRRDQD
jgi:DNA-binding transcriptional regulator YiaG